MNVSEDVKQRVSCAPTKRSERRNQRDTHTPVHLPPQPQLTKWTEAGHCSSVQGVKPAKQEEYGQVCPTPAIFAPFAGERSITIDQKWLVRGASSDGGEWRRPAPRIGVFS
ncbi:unnamed protein product [Heligmosomoides polygyrus]|uniref:Uncharacterized protein n=1 Tax=Heligmosomoides polygyrus TaxID=6339 RepID=A0A183FXD4_HELPZ|nr:unnamed protein product [Heligmosomoides polygyrus]